MNNGVSKYKTARKMSGLTQEKAAERLYIDVSTLRRIENGEQLCSKERAADMAELYNAPWVADPTAKDDYVPDNIHKALNHYIKIVDKDAKKIKETLLEIYDDGIVDNSEIDCWEEAFRKLEEACVASRDLRHSMAAHSAQAAVV